MFDGQDVARCCEQEACSPRDAVCVDANHRGPGAIQGLGLLRTAGRAGEEEGYSGEEERTQKAVAYSTA